MALDRLKGLFNLRNLLTQRREDRPATGSEQVSESSRTDLKKALTPKAQKHHDLAKLINNKLQSQEFSTALKKLETYDDRKLLIGLAIEYLTVHKDAFEFERYVQELIQPLELYEGLSTRKGHSLKKFMESNSQEMLYDSIKRKLNIEDDTPANQEKLLEFINTEIVENGYYYHSFNEAFNNSITDQGLSTQIRFWDWSDLEEIMAIGEKIGNKMILGWADINSKDLISLGNDPSNIYRYGIVSPEWFSRLVEGPQIPCEPGSDNETAFQRRDYDLAKENIELFLAREESKPQELIDQGRCYPKPSPKEADKIRKFFDKYWQVFATEKSKPKLALVSKGIAKPNSLRTMEAVRDKYSSYSDNPLFFHFKRFLREFKDQQIKSDIDKSNIAVVDLPYDPDIFTLGKVA